MVLPQHARMPQVGDMALVERIGENHPVLATIDGTGKRDGRDTFTYTEGAFWAYREDITLLPPEFRELMDTVLEGLAGYYPERMVEANRGEVYAAALAAHREGSGGQAEYERLRDVAEAKLNAYDQEGYEEAAPAAPGR